VAERKGLIAAADGCGVFGDDPERNWRIPDQVYVRPEDVMEEGVTSAELLVEVRSPGDESYLKLPYYAERGVTEVLIVHEDRQFELRRLQGDGTYVVVPGGRSATLDVTFSTVDGPKLRIEWEDGSAEV
jgi:Uma2 family endonuclease